MTSKIMLPDWVQDNMGKHLPVFVMKWSKEDNFFIVSPTGRIIEKSTDLTSLYYKYSFTESCALDYDDSLYDNPLVVESVLGSPSLKDGQVLIFNSGKDKTGEIMNAYKGFLELNDVYVRDQGDWVNAYHWLNHHPVFWVLSTSHNWVTNGGVESINHDVLTGGTVRLTAGAHVEPDYTTHYYDTRLSVVGKSFEDAFVELAKVVYRLYDSDGVEFDTPREEPNSPLLEALWGRLG